MPEPSAFDAAWRVVKEERSAYTIVPYDSLTPTSRMYARTDRMAQPSDPYIVHDDGRMPVREDRPRDPRDAIRRLHEKVRRDPTSPHYVPRASDLSDPTYYQEG
ncbi:MAG: hypothetical protein ACPF9I_06490 [Candidatus Thalassarchaeaceae archaeon]